MPGLASAPNPHHGRGLKCSCSRVRETERRSESKRSILRTGFRPTTLAYAGDIVLRGPLSFAERNCYRKPPSKSLASCCFALYVNWFPLGQLTLRDNWSIKRDNDCLPCKAAAL